MRRSGKILVDQLVIQGCERIFTVPGESFVSVFDAIHESDAIEAVVCRHEGGASMMADAAGKLTGRPGVCFVGRGVGAAHAMSGLHIANQDQTPLILFVGLIPSRNDDRDAWQEIDLKKFFGGVAKWSAVIADPKRIPEFVSRAFHTAMSGRPGPVVLGLPEDVLHGSAAVEDARRVVVAEPSPGAADMVALKQALAGAKRPMMLVGGPGWSGEVQDRLQAFAEAFDIPVITAWRNQDCFDNRHRCYAGDCHLAMDEALVARVEEADLLIVVGCRLDEISTRSYSMIAVPTTSQFLVHVHPSTDVAGGLVTADLPICATPKAFAEALTGLVPPAEAPWAAWREAARQAYLDHIEPLPTPGPVRLEEVVRHLADTLPDNAVISNGAGNYTLWIHRYFRFKRFRSQLAPAAGCMGYGLPAAIAAKLDDPSRVAVAFAGDGCFLMTGQELATAMRHGVAPIVIVPNNGMYGSIRMHQERQFPGRVEGTDLTNPDFVAFAESFGAYAEKVETTEEFPAAFARALKEKRPALLELVLDQESLTPRATLSQIRAASRK